MSVGPWYEEAFGPLYPVIYDHRDRGEAQRAVDGFAELLVPPVLDLACGTGRYLDALEAAGVPAFGLDLSPSLLGAASGGHAGRLVRADMRHIPVRDDSLGTVISMFTSFGYFETDAENRSVLAGVEAALRPGGALLLDFLNANLVVKSPPGDSRREAGGFVVVEKRSLSEDRRFLIKHVRAQSTSGDENVEYEERVRAYHSSELEELVSQAGLEIRDRFGDYDARPFDADGSPRLILLCGKPERSRR